MSLYPGALDSLNDPTSNTPMNSSSAGLAHSVQHQNTNSAIEAIQSTLGVNPAGTYAHVVDRLNAASYNGHGHVIGDTAGLQAALDSKAPLSHSHAESDITSLVSDLASKAGVTTSVTPSALGVAAIGTSTSAARADHVHLLPTLATLGAVASSVTVSTGTGLTGGGDLSTNRTISATYGGSGGDFGTATTLTRSDHIHDGRYFTETESDARFSAIAHNHNGVYAKVTALATGTALPAAAGYSDGDMIVFY